MFKDMNELCKACKDLDCVCGKCRGVGEESKVCEEAGDICEWKDSDTTCINFLNENNC